MADSQAHVFLERLRNTKFLKENAHRLGAMVADGLTAQRPPILSAGERRRFAKPNPGQILFPN